MVRQAVLTVVLALTLAGCASTGRMMAYGGKGMDAVNDAKFTDYGKTYKLWVHRGEDMVMIQLTIGDAASSGFVRGATFGLAEGNRPYDLWKHALEEFLAPVGCTIKDLRPINQKVAWEAGYTCPVDVDLRGLIIAQKPALRQGAPIHK